MNLILKSTLSSLVVAGVLAGACVGGVATAASAATTDHQDSGHTATSSDGLYIAGGAFTTHEGIALGPGISIKERNLASFELVNDADNKPKEMIAKWGSYGTHVRAVAAYQIIADGRETGYYIAPYIYTGHSAAWATSGCPLYQGVPEAGGKLVPDTSTPPYRPYKCDTYTPSWFSNDWVFDVVATGH